MKEPYSHVCQTYVFRLEGLDSKPLAEDAIEEQYLDNAMLLAWFALLYFPLSNIMEETALED